MGGLFDAIGDLPKIYPLPKPIIQNGKKYSHAPISSEKVMNQVILYLLICIKME